MVQLGHCPPGQLNAFQPQFKLRLLWKQASDPPLVSAPPSRDTEIKNLC
jgi:hypothetical protein